MPAICPYSEPERCSPYPSHPTSSRSILILSSHLRLGLPAGLFPSGFPTQTLYTPLLLTRYMPTHLIILDLITRTINYNNNNNYYYYLLHLSCNSVAVVETKQIRINIHKRNNTTNTVQTIQNTVNTSTHITKTTTFGKDLYNNLSCQLDKRICDKEHSCQHQHYLGIRVDRPVTNHQQRQ